MPPSVASLIFAVGIFGLFWLTRDEESETSWALWLPIVWFFIGASRSFSGWFGVAPSVTNPDQYLDGSPLDSVLLAVMLAGGLIVLAMRGRKSIAFIRENAPLIIFLAYCVFSVLWSDFPFTAFKRWTKALGNVVMVLIVLTDPKPAAAAKKFLTRPGFVIIPLSLLFIKYYPALGRTYDQWTGQVAYVGVVDVKNGLGWDCLVFGLGCVFSIFDVVRHAVVHKGRQLLAYGTILLMSLYLLHLANSATSAVCFLLGAGTILYAATIAKGKPLRLHLISATLVCGGLILYFFPESYGFFVHALGRQTDLTGRTDIWQDVLKLDHSPVVGNGFESFFLGERLHVLWAKYWWHPQEAHDGYLEIYLTLGWVGVGLLATLIVTGYRNVMRSLREDPDLGALRLACLLVAIMYNFTEAAFKVMHPIWILFLFAIVAIPRARVAVPVTKPIRVPVRKRAMRPAYPASVTTRSSA